MNERQNAQHRTWLRFAEERGGRLLSSEYDCREKAMLWRCGRGHVFRKSAKHIRRDWCPECKSPKRRAIQEARELASAMGGECVTRQIELISSPFTWRCSGGHTFTAGLRRIRSGRWCPACEKENGISFAGLEGMRKIAENRGGKCLSDEYEGVKAKLEFECEHGNVFLAQPQHIQGGQWCPCPNCANNEALGLGAMQIIAESKGGKCLSTSYVNSIEELDWVCAEGHRFEKAGKHVRAGGWCPVCQSEEASARGRLVSILKEHGATLISGYQNRNTPVDIACANGRQLSMLPSSVFKYGFKHGPKQQVEAAAEG